MPARFTRKTRMFGAHKTGTCPHCNVHVRFETVQINDMSDAGGVRFTTPQRTALDVISIGCPACGQVILVARNIGHDYVDTSRHVKLGNLLWPDPGARPVPEEVEAEAPTLAADFREATSVLPKSKKASAALARRCLQFILREKGGAQSKDLAPQIDEVINNLPPELGENVDAIRQVGNFAAHPIKSTNSGEIADVEEGEAEWLLSILEDLFDHYYVAPARASKRRASLNQRLQDFGKPALKQPQC